MTNGTFVSVTSPALVLDASRTYSLLFRAGLVWVWGPEALSAPEGVGLGEVGFEAVAGAPAAVAVTLPGGARGYGEYALPLLVTGAAPAGSVLSSEAVVNGAPAPCAFSGHRAGGAAPRAAGPLLPAPFLRAPQRHGGRQLRPIRRAPGALRLGRFTPPGEDGVPPPSPRPLSRAWPPLRG